MTDLTAFEICTFSWYREIFCILNPELFHSTEEHYGDLPSPYISNNLDYPEV